MLMVHKKTEDFDKITIIAGINGIIAQTMSYIDNVFTNNDINKLDPSNEKGYQFTKRIYWGIRGLFENNDTKHAGLQDLRRLYDAIFDLNIIDKTSLEGLYDAIYNFEKDTNVEQISSLALDSSGSYAHTIPTVLKQANIWLDTMVDVVGTIQPYYNKLGQRKHKRKGWFAWR